MVVGTVFTSSGWRICRSADAREGGGVRIAWMADVVGLPWYATSFVIVPEAGLLARLVGVHRVVTVLGPGGAGKTRLAVEVVSAVGAGYERCIFVDVPTASSATGVAPLVAERFGARLRHSDPIDAIESTLGQGRTLLVLDSCEPYVTVCAELVHDLISRIGGLDVLCTSRQPLGLDGEVHVRLGPLRDRAVALFVDRAVLVDPTFDPMSDPAAIELIERVCEAADGLPLAIELAAAQLAFLPMAQIAKGVSGRMHLLERESYTGAARHRSMRACVEWSLELLTDDERSVLRMLSVFAGSFDMEAAQIVLDRDEAGAARVVSRLVARSLLVAEGVQRSRYRSLDVVREVIAAQGCSSDEQERASARHLHWAVERCKTAAAELEGSGLEECVRALLADDADLTVAFQRAIDRDDLNRAETMYGSLALHWITSGRFKQAEAWFEACRTLADNGSLGARTTWAAALVAVYAGRRTEAVELANQTLEQARAAGDDLVAARALDVLGFATMPSDPAAAEALLVKAATGAAAAGDPWCHADASQIAGYASLSRGRPDEARVHLLRARPIAERLGHPQLLAWDHAGVSLVDAASGHFRRAAAGLVEALVHADRTGDPNITGSVIAFHCHVSVFLGDAATWIAPVDDLLQRCLRLGAGQGAAELVIARMELAVALDDPDTANDLWLQSAGPVGAAAPGVHRRLVHVGAAAALAACDPAEARLRLRSIIGQPSMQVDALTETWRAVVALHADDAGAARRHLRRATDDTVMPSALIEQHDLALAWAALITAEANDALAAQALDAAGGMLIGDAAALSLIARMVTSRLQHIPSAACVGPSDPLRAVAIARSRGRRSSGRFGWTSLTPTERKVAALAAQGLTNRTIADRLHCSAGTVKSHLEHIYAKTGIANRTELAADRDRLDHPPSR